SAVWERKVRLWEGAIRASVAASGVGRQSLSRTRITNATAGRVKTGQPAGTGHAKRSARPCSWRVQYCVHAANVNESPQPLAPVDPRRIQSPCCKYVTRHAYLTFVE